jgi:hypothetical protein
MTQAAILAASGSPGTTTGFKNRIINGNMAIDQRNAGAQVIPADGQYSLDRWQCFQSVANKYKFQQNAGSVTPPVGFSNYLGITSLTAYSVSSTDYNILRQSIEGYNIADLGWGTANAKTITLSFQVYSSLTGTFGGSLQNSAQNRSYPFSYTISAANTWTSISITIAGDTSGTWQSTTSAGIYLQFGLGVGTTYSGTAGSWSGGNYYTTTGATSVVGTNGATWYMTGCQFEVGTTATNFDFRSYGTELALCQRYYQKTDVLGIGTTPSSTQIYMVIPFTVTMRAAPTASVAGTTWALTDGYAGDANASSPTINGLDTYSTTSIRLQLGGFSGLTVGRVYFWRAVSTSLIGFSAEL